MFEKLNAICNIEDELAESEFLLRMNKWDDELTEFMHHSEEKCQTFNMDHIEWSPKVGVWLAHCWILNRIQRYLDGKVKDAHNLVRVWKKQELPNPRVITQEELDLNQLICYNKIKSLEK